MKSRRERRAEARANKTTFEPQYSLSTKTGRGGTPKSFEEKFGVGYERFNNKFVTIKEVEESTEEATTEQA